MEIISRHIEYLLQRHDCVIVPGLGAFIAVSAPARYDAVRDIFLPPTRTVSFNAAISNDDGLLVNSYARRCGIGYEAAREQMQRDTAALRSRLSQFGSVQIGYVGTLSADAEERISFRPTFDENEIRAMLGMPPLSMAYKAPEAPRAEAEAGTPAEVSAVAAEPLSVRTPVGMRRIKPGNYYIPVSKTFARAAASVMVVLAVALAVLAIPYRSADRAVEASVVPVEKILRWHPAPIQLDSPVAEKDDSTAPESVAEAKATPQKSVAANDAASERWHLVVATFHSAKDADNYVASAPDGVREDMRVVVSGGTYRVSLRSSADRAEMVSLLNSGVARRFEGAWIWEQKH